MHDSTFIHTKLNPNCTTERFRYLFYVYYFHFKASEEPPATDAAPMEYDNNVDDNNATPDYRNYDQTPDNSYNQNPEESPDNSYSPYDPNVYRDITNPQPYGQSTRSDNPYDNSNPLSRFDNLDRATSEAPSSGYDQGSGSYPRGDLGGANYPSSTGTNLNYYVITFNFFFIISYLVRLWESCYKIFHHNLDHVTW